MLICYGLCGSFCTVRRSLAILETLKKQNFDLLPVCSFHFCSTDTRFGSAAEHLRKIEDICEKTPIVTLRDAEPIGPKYKPELMVIAPLTGNSLAKLNHGISIHPSLLPQNPIYETTSPCFWAWPPTMDFRAISGIWPLFMAGKMFSLFPCDRMTPCKSPIRWSAILKRSRRQLSSP